MTHALDLNSDVGEGFPYDAELMAVITSANVACGFHAGDESSMRATCDLAVRHGVAVGAQVSYRDREGFGRRDLDVEPQRLLADLVEQTDALDRAAAAAGTRVRYLKPHGALYNRVVWDREQAAAVVESARIASLPVLGLPGSAVLELAGLSGLATFREFFADRAYDAAGRLVSRSETGAVITDPVVVAHRVEALVASASVIAAGGEEVRVEADSICVHGDTDSALSLATAVHRALVQSGCEVVAFT